MPRLGPSGSKVTPCRLGRIRQFDADRPRRKNLNQSTAQYGER